MTKIIEQKTVYPNKESYKDRPLAVRLGAKFFPYHDKFGAKLAEFFLPSFLTVNYDNVRTDINHIYMRLKIGEAMEALGLIAMFGGLEPLTKAFGFLSYFYGREATKSAEESSLIITSQSEQGNDNKIRKEVKQKKVEINLKNHIQEFSIDVFPLGLSNIPYEAIDSVKFNYMLKSYGKDKRSNAVSIRFQNQDYFDLEDNLRQLWGQDFSTFFQMDFENTTGTSEDEIKTSIVQALNMFSQRSKQSPPEEKPLVFVTSDKGSNSKTKIIEQTDLFEETVGLLDGRKIYVLNWEKALATNNT